MVVNKTTPYSSLFESGESLDYQYLDGQPTINAYSNATGHTPQRKKLVQSARRSNATGHGPVRKKLDPASRRAPAKKGGLLGKLGIGKNGGLAANFRKNQTLRQERKNAEVKNTSDAIKAMGKSGPALKLGALPKDEPSKGLSMGAKIGIGAGIALVLGVIGFVIYKKRKKK